MLAVDDFPCIVIAIDLVYSLTEDEPSREQALEVELDSSRRSRPIIPEWPRQGWMSGLACLPEILDHRPTRLDVKFAIVNTSGCFSPCALEPAVSQI